MNEHQISLAQPDDLAPVQRLLRVCDLPYQDVDQHLPNFFVAKKDAQLVGVIGLEALNSVGLLRSLAVAEQHRQRGLAQSLYKKLVFHARENGIEQLYLLTLTAEAFFAKLGFEIINRTTAPTSVQSTQEFQHLCPDTAVCMVKNIGREEIPKQNETLRRYP